MGHTAFLWTRWYLQYHRTCERVCHSRMTVSFRADGQVRATETVPHLAGTAEPFRVTPPQGGGLPVST